MNKLSDKEINRRLGRIYEMAIIAYLRNHPPEPSKERIFPLLEKEQDHATCHRVTSRFH
jgi:hypothetical protein